MNILIINGFFKHQGIPGTKNVSSPEKVKSCDTPRIALYNYRRENYYDNV